MFEFDTEYVRPSDPNQIRDDFHSLTDEFGCDPADLLKRLSCYLPTDTLAEFMDDLAMGRV